MISLFCIVFENLYSACHSIEAYRSTFWCNLLQENRQVLRRNEDVERLEERKVTRENRVGKTIPQRGTDDSKRSRLSHSRPCPGDKGVLSIRGAKRTRGCSRKRGVECSLGGT